LSLRISCQLFFANSRLCAAGYRFYSSPPLPPLPSSSCFSSPHTSSIDHGNLPTSVSNFSPQPQFFRRSPSSPLTNYSTHSVYCSLLMLTLFTSSCYWSDRCFLDSNNGHWFEPRILTTATAAFNTAAGSIASTAGDSALGNTTDTMGVWTGIGLDWLRSLVGRREWRLPCVDVNVRL